jgi:DNA-directed RNA polymerase specialized sigma24 family protein
VLSAGSVTVLIARLQAGDCLAARQLWERYFRRLVGLARRKLKAVPRGAADEEDVALSALGSFCRGAEQRRFSKIRDWDGLWRLLAAITAHKALDLARRQGRQKRGGGAVLDEAALASAGPDGMSLEQVLGREPSPDFALQVTEECQRLLQSLGDDTLRSLALWKTAGCSNGEIATQLGCAPRTIGRKLRLIRTLWSQQAPD